MAPVFTAVPSLPVGPILPVGPVFPLGPVLPVAPVYTAVPGIPCIPVGPVLPVAPLNVPSMLTFPFSVIYTPVCPNKIFPNSESIKNKPVPEVCIIFVFWFSNCIFVNILSCANDIFIYILFILYSINNIKYFNKKLNL